MNYDQALQLAATILSGNLSHGNGSYVLGNTEEIAKRLFEIANAIQKEHETRNSNKSYFG